MTTDFSRAMWKNKFLTDLSKDELIEACGKLLEELAWLRHPESMRKRATERVALYRINSREITATIQLPKIANPEDLVS